MMSDDEVRLVVQRLLDEKFDNLHVRSVKVSTDPDDSSLLLVSVIYENHDHALDGKRVSGFVRSLRPALFEANEERFPVLSFVENSDMEHWAGAA